MSKEFLEIVGKNVLSSRPAWRVNASGIDTSADSVLLISDHSLFSGNFFLNLNLTFAPHPIAFEHVSKLV